MVIVWIESYVTVTRDS